MTVREHYTRQRMEDCYYELFALCQEGMLSIKYEAVEFEDGERGLINPFRSGKSDMFSSSVYYSILYAHLYKILERVDQPHGWEIP